MNNKLLEEFTIEVDQDYVNNIEDMDYLEQAVLVYNCVAIDNTSFRVSNKVESYIKSNANEIIIILEDFYKDSGEEDYVALANFTVKEYLSNADCIY